jgi:hypothetical protein
LAEILRAIGKRVSQGKDNLEEYATAIEQILQRHDSVEVIRRDGMIVKLK